MKSEIPQLKYEAGTLILDGVKAEDAVPQAFVWDARTKQFRAPAHLYREIVTELVRSKAVYEDAAKNYAEFDFAPKFRLEPRPYQSAAIEAWKANKRCGVIVLPTGAGKTHAATMAIEMCGRQTLVVVPTIDLMNQWYELLISTFNAEIGLNRRRILRNRRDYGDDLRVGFSASGKTRQSVRADNFRRMSSFAVRRL